MSAIEDVRKLLQDIVTPDFKALEGHVADLSKKLDLRSDMLDGKIEMNRDILSDKIDFTRDLLLAEMKAMRVSTEAAIAGLRQSIDLEKRVAKIENERTM